ncbi:MAG: hypothetical protein HZC54_15255 [Verrucomicrobia bacterium]|nr:hypothetical protein [Verrucomicrobiota bacterium]
MRPNKGRSLWPLGHKAPSVPQADPEFKEIQGQQVRPEMTARKDRPARQEM